MDKGAEVELRIPFDVIWLVCRPQLLCQCILDALQSWTMTDWHELTTPFALREDSVSSKTLCHSELLSTLQQAALLDALR